MARCSEKARGAGSSLKDLRVGIVGLGLMGGSVVRALCRKAGLSDIVAVDPDKTALARALHDGAVRAVSPDFEVLSACEAVFVCTPVDHVPGCLAAAGRVCPGALFTDVSSTKAELVRIIKQDPFLRGLRFVPGHPMTGAEKTGYPNADEHMFENAYYILCDDMGNHEDLAAAEGLASAMGALPLRMGSSRHDRLIAYISHLPHLAASALVGLAAGADTDDGILRRLAAGGFKDITRVASSDPALWRSIFQSGRQTALAALADYMALLSGLYEKLSDGRFEELEAFLKGARDYRDCLPRGRGALAADCELWVNIPDRPGVIGEAATLLGGEDLSILNLNIQNSREYEGGVLRITFKNAADRQRAEALMTAHGYDMPRRR